MVNTQQWRKLLEMARKAQLNNALEDMKVLQDKAQILNLGGRRPEYMPGSVDSDEYAKVLTYAEESNAGNENGAPRLGNGAHLTKYIADLAIIPGPVRSADGEEVGVINANGSSMELQTIINQQISTVTIYRQRWLQGLEGTELPNNLEQQPGINITPCPNQPKPVTAS